MEFWLFSTATTCSRHRLPGAIHRACAACLPCLHPHARLQPLVVSAASPTCASPDAAGTALPRSTSTTLQPLVHTRDTLRRRDAREVRAGPELNDPDLGKLRRKLPAPALPPAACRCRLPPATCRVPRASVPQPIRTRHALPSHTPRVRPGTLSAGKGFAPQNHSYTPFPLTTDPNPNPNPNQARPGLRGTLTLTPDPQLHTLPSDH